MIKRRVSFWRLPYILPPTGLKSHKDTYRQEGEDVIKGTGRRVIVVNSPDPKVFEEAIFVVRDDFLHKPGISQKELMRQAKAAANSYVGTMTKKRRLGFLYRSRAPFIAAAGAAVTGLAYVVLHMAGVY